MLLVLLMTSVAVSPISVPAFAKSDNSKDKTKQIKSYTAKNAKIEEKIGPKVTKLEHVSSGKILFEELKKKDGVQEYVNSIKKITVQGTVCKGNDEKGYTVSEEGLLISDSNFENGQNKVIIEATGYKQKHIIVAKTDGTYTFISQEDKNLDEQEEKVDKDILQKEIQKAKSIKKGKKLLNLWQKLKDAIEYGEKINADPNASVSEIKKSVNELRDAVDKYNDAPDVPEVENPVKDGTYTLSFVANYEGQETSSMLQNTLDGRAKLVVKDGKMKVSFLGILFEGFVLDYALIENDKFQSMKKNILKNKKPEFTAEIKDLKSNLKLAALLMIDEKGQADNIGKADCYKKADLIFTKIEPGFKEYKYDEEHYSGMSGKDRLNQILLSYKLDKNNDGYVDKEELKAFPDDKINLSNQGLTDISQLEGLPETVEELILNNNDIKVIPPKLLHGLKNLKIFYIENNKVEKIPKGLFRDCKNMDWVSFWGNNIRHIDKDAFAGLTNLTELSLIDCNLTTLPDGCLKPMAKSLKNFLIIGNKFKTLPKCIEDAKNMTAIYAGENQITDVSNIDFGKLPNLEDIRLSSNRIKYVKSKTFAKNKKLLRLELFDNHLRDFPADAFPKYHTMLSVQIQMNYINVVNPDIKKRTMGYDKYYPQKTALSISTKSSGNKIEYKQNISILNLMFWYYHTCDAMTRSIDSLDEYYDYLEERNWSGKNFIPMLNERGYDWSVLTELQKKNSRGDFVTVEKKLVADKEDAVKGTFKSHGKGTYRIKKSLYHGLSGHKEYRFNIISKDFNIGLASGKVTPIRLKAKGKARAVVLNWNKNGKAKTYEVYRKLGGDKKFKKIKSLKKTSFTDKKLKPGKTVRYYVLAKNGKTTVKKSNTVKTHALMPKVVKLKAKKSGKKVKISWKKVSAAKGYKLYISSSKNGKFKFYKTVKGGSLRIPKKVLRGKRYIKIIAFNKQTVSEARVIRIM